MNTAESFHDSFFFFVGEYEKLTGDRMMKRVRAKGINKRSMWKHQYIIWHVIRSERFIPIHILLFFHPFPGYPFKRPPHPSRSHLIFQYLLYHSIDIPFFSGGGLVYNWLRKGTIRTNLIYSSGGERQYPSEWSSTPKNPSWIIRVMGLLLVAGIRSRKRWFDRPALKETWYYRRRYWGRAWAFCRFRSSWVRRPTGSRTLNRSSTSNMVSPVVLLISSAGGEGGERTLIGSG